MAKAIVKDLYITRGDDDVFLLKFKQSVAGSKFFLTAKRNKSDADVDAVITATATPIAPDYFTAILTSPHVQSALLTERSYYYDVQWVDASSSVKTIIKGKVHVDLDVTIGIV